MYKTKLFFLSIKLDFYQWMHKVHSKLMVFHKNKTTKLYPKVKKLKADITGMTNRVKGK